MPAHAPQQAAERLIQSADGILAGHWQVFARVHDALGERPDWFVDIKSEHMVQAIAAIIKDPAIVATRKAWQEAVDRGEKLFADPALGKNEYSCKSCHDPARQAATMSMTLRNVSDALPRWDPSLKRFVDINEAINRMIGEKLGGEQLPPNDQRLYDLLAYLKTLK